MSGMTPDFETALAAMDSQPPKDWWRFVPCGTCNARRGEVCRMGGWSWPKPAWRPHAARYRAGLELHGVLWLLRNGHALDVIGTELAHQPTGERA